MDSQKTSLTRPNRSRSTRLGQTSRQAQLQARQQRTVPSRSCTFCGYPIPGGVPPREWDGWLFCSRACRDAFTQDTDPFRGTFDYKQYYFNVDVLTTGLPDGIPGNAAVLFAGDEGTRLQTLLHECIWRALQRGEPAVILSTDKPPVSLVDSFLSHGWNVIPYLDRSHLQIVDLFTGRLHDADAISTHNNRWNKYLRTLLTDAVTRVRDPSDVLEIANKTDQTLQETGMLNTGIVAIDYLTELAAFAQAARATNLLREIRAVVCKTRYVPLLAGASVPRTPDLYPTTFPHNHEYLFDGIIDLEINDELVANERITRLSIRKMDDVPANHRWLPYTYQPARGFIPTTPGSTQPTQ